MITLHFAMLTSSRLQTFFFFFSTDETYEDNQSDQYIQSSRSRRDVLETLLDRLLHPKPEDDIPLRRSSRTTSTDNRTLRHMLRSHRHSSSRHKKLSFNGDSNENGWGGGYGK